MRSLTTLTKRSLGQNPSDLAGRQARELLRKLPSWSCYTFQFMKLNSQHIGWVRVGKTGIPRFLLGDPSHTPSHLVAAESTQKKTGFAPLSKERTESEKTGEKKRTALRNQKEQKTGDNKMQRNQKRGPLNRDTAQYWMACKRQKRTREEKKRR